MLSTLSSVLFELGGKDRQMHELIKTAVEFNSILMGVGLGSIVSVLGVLIRTVEKIKAKFRLIEMSNLALLHNEIYKECHRLIQQGWVTVDDLNNLEHLWDGYHGLGGNGTGERLYKEVLALPIREKGEN